MVEGIYTQINAVAIGKLHEVAEAAGLLWGWVSHVLGHLQNHHLTEAANPLEGIAVGRHIGDEVDDVEVLEGVARRVGVGARAVEHDGADAVILAGGAENQVEYFLFATHKTPQCVIGDQGPGMVTDDGSRRPA
ncbi:MAG: hypothetical protein BWY79_01937 [Actinobacteria bacterium ADurb.Bin444]|nr:MAG: hypothetical protein BWY79_01937 [Actinobacteria bacterium ADurb.Bin444]